jgi:hypothetical protein
MDAVADGHAVSRLLWRFDRGAFPRSAERLRRVLEEVMNITDSSSLQVFHRYEMYAGAPRKT